MAKTKTRKAPVVRVVAVSVVGGVAVWVRRGSGGGGGSSGGGGDGGDIDAVNSGGDDFFLPDSVDAVPVGT